MELNLVVSDCNFWQFDRGSQIAERNCLCDNGLTLFLSSNLAHQILLLARCVYVCGT